MHTSFYTERHAPTNKCIIDHQLSSSNVFIAVNASWLVPKSSSIPVPSLPRSFVKPGKAALTPSDRALRRIRIKEASVEPGDISLLATARVSKCPDSKAMLFRAAKNHYLLRFLNEREVAEMINVMMFTTVQPGQNIITQGSPGRCFYILESGQCEIFINDERIGWYENGDAFGELALLYNCPRAATIRSVNLCVLWSVDRTMFRKIIATTSAEAQNARYNFLKNVDLFKALNNDQLHLVASALRLHSFQDGEYILRQGEEGDTFYIIIQGEVCCTARGTGADDKEKQLMILQPGSYFGEMALMLNEPRQANCIAISEVKCYAMDRTQFTTLLGPLHALIDRQMRIRVLRSVPLLSSLKEDELDLLAHNLNVIVFEDKDVIIVEGDDADTFYMISDGVVSIQKGDTEIYKLQSGEFFGERSLFSNEPRSATCIAVGRVECLTLNRDAFEQMLGQLEHIMQREMRRQQQMEAFAFIGSKQAHGTSVLSGNKRKCLELNELEKIRIIGTGTFGRVYLVNHPLTNQAFALKCMQKVNVVSSQQERSVLNEKCIVSECDHPFILKLVETFSDKDQLYMLFKLVPGGELWSLLYQNPPKLSPKGPCGAFQISTARFYAATVIEILRYLQEKNIAYRDLKPENLVLDEMGYIKLVDFGFAKRIPYTKDGFIHQRSFTLCGTPEYLAPELVLNKGHGKAVDHWALGCLLYELIIGRTPFHHKSQSKMFEKILQGRDFVSFPPNFDEDAKDLVLGLLEPNPGLRLGSLAGGMQDVIRHPFFAGFDWNSLVNKTMVAPYIPEVKDSLDVHNFDIYPDDGEILSYTGPNDLFDEFEQIAWFGTLGTQLDEEAQKLVRSLRSGFTEGCIPFDQLTPTRWNALQILRATGNELLQCYEYRAATLFFYDPIHGHLIQSTEMLDLKTAKLSSIDIMGIELYIDAIYKSAFCRFRDAIPSDRVIRQINTYDTLYEAIKLSRKGLEVAVNASQSHTNLVPNKSLKHQFAWLVMNGINWIVYMVKKLQSCSRSRFSIVDTVEAHSTEVYSERVLVPFLTYCLLCMDSQLMLSTVHFLKYRMHLYQLILDMYVRLSQKSSTLSQMKNYLVAASACVGRAESGIKRLRKVEEYELPLPSNVESCLKYAESIVRFQIARVQSAEVGFAEASARLGKKIATEKLTKAEMIDIFNWAFTEEILEKALSVDSEKIIVLIDYFCKVNLEYLEIESCKQRHKALVSYLYKLLDPFLKTFMEKVDEDPKIADRKEAERELSLTLPFVSHLSILGHFHTGGMLTELETLLEIISARQSMLLIDPTKDRLARRVQQEIKMYVSLNQFERKLSQLELTHESIKLDDFELILEQIRDVCMAITACIKLETRERCQFKCDDIPPHLKECLIDTVLSLWKRFEVSICTMSKIAPINQTFSLKEVKNYEIGSDLLLAIHQVLLAVDFDDVAFQASITLRLASILHNQEKYTDATDLLRRMIEKIGSERGRIIIHTYQRDKESQVNAQSGPSDSFEGEVGSPLGCTYDSLVSSEYDLYALLFRAELNRNSSLHRSDNSESTTKRCLKAEFRRNGYLLHSYHLQKLCRLCANETLRSAPYQSILDSASKLINDIHLNLESIEKQEEKSRESSRPTLDTGSSKNCERSKSLSENNNLLPPKILCRSATAVIVRYQPNCEANKMEDMQRCGEHLPSYYMLYGNVAKAGTQLSIASKNLPGTGIRLPSRTICSTEVQVSGLEPNEKYNFAFAAFDDKNQILFGGIGKSISVVALNPIPMVILKNDLAKTCAGLYRQIPRNNSDTFETLIKALHASSSRAAEAVYESITTGSVDDEETDPQGRQASIWIRNPFNQRRLNHTLVPQFSAKALKSCVSSILLLCERTRGHISLDLSALNRYPLLLIALEKARKSLLGTECALMCADNVNAKSLLFHSYRFLLPWLDLTKSTKMSPNVFCIKSWIFEAIVAIFESSLLIVDNCGDQEEDLLAMAACTAFEIVKILALNSSSLDTTLKLLGGMRDKKARKNCKEATCFYEILSLIELATSFTFETTTPTSLTPTAAPKQNMTKSLSQSQDPSTIEHFDSIEECTEKCRNSNITFQTVTSKLLSDGTSFKLDRACKLCHIALQREVEIDNQGVPFSTTILARISANMRLQMKTKASMQLRQFINSLGQRGTELTSAQEDGPEDQSEVPESEFHSGSQADDQFLARWSGEYFFLHVIRLYRICIRAHQQKNSEAGNLHRREVNNSWPLRDCFERSLSEAVSKHEYILAEEDQALEDIIETISLCSRCFVYAEAWGCVQVSIEYLWNTIYISWACPEISAWSDNVQKNLVHCINTLIRLIESAGEETAVEITPSLSWISEMITFTLNSLTKHRSWHHMISVGRRYHEALISASLIKGPCGGSFSMAASKFGEKWSSRLVVVQSHYISAQSARKNAREGVISGMDDMIETESDALAGSLHPSILGDTVDLESLRLELKSIQGWSNKVNTSKSECQCAMEDCQRLRKEILFLNRPSHSKMAKILIAYERCLKLCCEKLEKAILARGFCELGDLQWDFQQKQAAAESWQDGIDYIFELINVLDSWPKSLGEIESIDVDSTLMCQIIQVNGNQTDSHAERAWLALHAIVLVGRLVLTQSSANLMLKHSRFGAHLVRLVLPYLCVTHPTRAFLYGSYNIGSSQELWPGHPILSSEESCVSPFSLVLSILSLVSVLLASSGGASKYSQNNTLAVTGYMTTTPLETVALPSITLYESIARIHAQDLLHSVNAKRLRVEALTLAGRFEEALTQWGEIEALTKTSAWAFTSSYTLQSLLTCWAKQSQNVLVNKFRNFSKTHPAVNDNGICKFVAWVESIDLAVLRSQLDAQLNDCVFVSLLFTTLIRLLTAITTVIVGLQNVEIINLTFGVQTAVAVENLVSVLLENIQDHKGHRYCVTSWNGAEFLVVDLKSLQIQLAIAQRKWNAALSFCDDALNREIKRSVEVDGNSDSDHASRLSFEWRVPTWAFYVPHHQRLEIHIMRISILLQDRHYYDVVVGANTLLNTSEMNGACAHLVVQLAFLQMRAYLCLGDLEAANNKIEWIFSQCRVHSFEHSLLYVHTLRASNEVDLLLLNRVAYPTEKALFDLYRNLMKKLTEAEVVVDMLLEEVGWCGLSQTTDRNVNIYLSAIPTFGLIKLDIAHLFLHINPFSELKDYEKILVKIQQGLKSIDETVQDMSSIRIRLLLCQGMIQRRYKSLQFSCGDSTEIISVLREAISCCIQSGNHDRALLRAASIELVAQFVYQWEHDPAHSASFQEVHRYMELVGIIEDQEDLLSKSSEQQDIVIFDKFESIPPLVMDELRHFSMFEHDDPAIETRLEEALDGPKKEVTSTQLTNLLIRSYRRRDTFAGSFAYHDAVTKALHRFLLKNCPVYAENCSRDRNEAQSSSKIPLLSLCWGQTHPHAINSHSLYVMTYGRGKHSDPDATTMTHDEDEKNRERKHLKHLIFTRQQRTLLQDLGQHARALRLEAEASSDHESAAYRNGWIKLLSDLQIVCGKSQEERATSIDRIEQKLKSGNLGTPEGAEGITSFAVSIDKRLIAIAEKGSLSAQIHIYDASTLKRCKTIALTESSACISVEFSLDRKYIISQSTAPDYNLSLWLWEKLKLVASIKMNASSGWSNGQSVHTARISPSDGMNICVSGNGNIKFFKLIDNQFRPQTATIKRETPKFTSHAWITEERIVASSDTGDLWYFEQNEIRQIISSCFGEGHYANSIVGYSKGFICAGTEGIVYLFDRVDEGREYYRKMKSFRIDASVSSICSIAKSSSEDVLVCCLDNNQLYSLVLSSTDILKEDMTSFDLLSTSNHFAGAFGSDITGLDTCIRKPLIVTCGLDKSLRVWNYIDHTIEVMKIFKEEMYSVAFHPSGLHVIVGFSDKLKMLNVLMDTIRPFRQFAIKACQEVRFSHGGQNFAAVNNNVVHVYATYTGELLTVLRGHSNRVNAITWRKNDRSLLTCGLDGHVLLWNLRTAGKIGSSHSQARCVYLDTTVTCGGDIAYATGNDGYLREIEMSSGSIKAEHLTKLALGPMALANSQQVLYAGSVDPDTAGSIFVFHVPLCNEGTREQASNDRSQLGDASTESVAGNSSPDKDATIPLVKTTARYSEYRCHDRAITRLRLSCDSKYLFSVSQDGVLAVFTTQECSARSTKTDSSNTSRANPTGLTAASTVLFAEEILITKSELEEKQQVMMELKAKVDELTHHNDYQLRSKEISCQESLQDMKHRLSAELAQDKQRCADIKLDQRQMEREYEKKMQEIQRQQQQERQEMEVMYEGKIKVENERLTALQQSCDLQSTNYQQENSQLVQHHSQVLAELTTRYDQQIALEHNVQREAHCKKQDIMRRNDQYHNDLDKDADKEIESMQYRFEVKMNEEREILTRLRSENTIMKKKFTSLQQDIEDQKEEIRAIEEKSKEIMETIKALKKDVVGHQKEIREREETIQDKEKRIFDLKKKNQELEKFKFVLDYKIKELTRQIEPREQEIVELQKQIQEMDLELEQYQKSNSALDLMVGDLRLKMDGMQVELQNQTREMQARKQCTEQIRMDLTKCAKHAHDPKELKFTLIQFNKAYGAFKSPIRMSENGEVVHSSECSRRRDYLEKEVGSLKKKIVNNLSWKESEVFRLQRENALLSVQANELRRELHTTQAKCSEVKKSNSAIDRNSREVESDFDTRVIVSPSKSQNNNETLSMQVGETIRQGPSSEKKSTQAEYREMHEQQKEIMRLRVRLSVLQNTLGGSLQPSTPNISGIPGSKSIINQAFSLRIGPNHFPCAANLLFASYQSTMQKIETAESDHKLEVSRITQRWTPTSNRRTLAIVKHTRALSFFDPTTLKFCRYFMLKQSEALFDDKVVFAFTLSVQVGLSQTDNFRRQYSLGRMLPRYNWGDSRRWYWLTRNQIRAERNSTAVTPDTLDSKGRCNDVKSDFGFSCRNDINTIDSRTNNQAMLTNFMQVMNVLPQVIFCALVSPCCAQLYAFYRSTYATDTLLDRQKCSQEVMTASRKIDNEHALEEFEVSSNRSRNDSVQRFCRWNVPHIVALSCSSLVTTHQSLYIRLLNNIFHRTIKNQLNPFMIFKMTSKYVVRK
uniref:cGMP-dependent protein kinase n=1 Tax=Albugo laibachii Nc14 TaxID=890382 RepID=F0W1L6_9STRA|nr:conserved unknown protein putative [Albugo laibachii Nc14]|eukprot:CCA14945.1 conserved unknown protein putative [Albugo laibachii Nc14]